MDERSQQHFFHKIKQNSELTRLLYKLGIVIIYRGRSIYGNIWTPQPQRTAYFRENYRYSTRNFKWHIYVSRSEKLINYANRTLLSYIGEDLYTVIFGLHRPQESLILEKKLTEPPDYFKLFHYKIYI